MEEAREKKKSGLFQFLKNNSENRPPLIIKSVRDVVDDLQGLQRMKIHGFFMIKTELWQVSDLFEFRYEKADQSYFQSKPENFGIGRLKKQCQKQVFCPWNICEPLTFHGETFLCLLNEIGTKKKPPLVCLGKGSEN